MTNSNIILTLLIIHSRVTIIGICCIIDNFQSFVNEIAFLVLPLGIGLLDAFQKDAWAIVMVEIVLFECEHLVIVLSHVIPSFEVLFQIEQVLHILVQDIH